MRGRGLTKQLGPGTGSKAGPDVEPDDERTVRLNRKRFARRQRARRWLAWRRVLAILAAVAAVAAVVWLFFFSTALSVSGATVTGSTGAQAVAAERAAAVPVGSPLVLADLDAVAARVESLAFVRSAEVSRSWPDKLRIDVAERVPVAVVPRGGSFTGLDAEGVLFGGYAERPAGLPVVRAGEGIRTEALAEAARVAASLPGSLDGTVDYVDVQSVDQISVRLRDDRTIVWGSADDSAAKGRVVAVLLEQKASTYDVSVPGQPVLRN